MAKAIRQRDLPVPPERWACRSASAVVLFVGVIAAGLMGDLLSKHFAFESLLSNPRLGEQIALEKAMRDGTTREIIHREPVAAVLKRPIIPGVVWFTLSTNPGIVFGSQVVPRWAVNVATILTVLVISLGFFPRSDRGDRWMHVALACIVGGALGNLYDRALSVVTFPGGLAPICNEVRDFIDFSEIGYRWVFNIADALLVVGVAIIFLKMLFPGKKKDAASPSDAAKTSS